MQIIKKLHCMSYYCYGLPRQLRMQNQLLVNNVEKRMRM
jgi:hypothetical protein